MRPASLSRPSACSRPTRLAGRHGHTTPGEVGHEFVACSKSDTLSYEQIPRKSTLSEVAQSSFIAEQAVSVELDSGSKGAVLVVAPNWRTVTERTAPANDVRYGRNCTFAQAECSDSERELLDLLDERNSISANLATEAHKTRGTDVRE